MKSLPILLNAHEVRAIRSGTQTQLRRPIKASHSDLSDALDVRWLKAWNQYAALMRGGGNIALRCPFGAVGDHLWCRETTSEIEPCFLGGRAQPTVWYRADKNRPMWAERRWTPSIHMPRRLSRIDLGITDIRVLRLQDINEADARAEGVIRENLPPDPDNFHPPGSYGYVPGHLPFPQGRIYVTAKEAYQDLWESIYGAGSWSLNPWLWCLTFRCISAAQTECVK